MIDLERAIWNIFFIAFLAIFWLWIRAKLSLPLLLPSAFSKTGNKKLLYGAGQN